MRFLLLVMLFAFCFISYAQEYKGSPYYHQRASLFEILPTSSEDIIFLGNSITDGAECIELFMNNNIKNRGISGDTAEGILNRLSCIIQAHPKKIFLLIGVNDLYGGKSPQVIAFTIETIIKEIRKESPQTIIYLQSVLPCNGELPIDVKQEGGIEKLNFLLKEIARKNKITFIDLYSKFREGESNKINPAYSNDGLHLIGKGYLLWKQILLPYID